MLHQRADLVVDEFIEHLLAFALRSYDPRQTKLGEVLAHRRRVRVGQLRETSDIRLPLCQSEQQTQTSRIANEPQPSRHLVDSPQRKLHEVLYICVHTQILQNFDASAEAPFGVCPLQVVSGDRSRRRGANADKPTGDVVATHRVYGTASAERSPMRYRTIILAAAALLLLASCGSDKNASSTTGGTSAAGGSQPTFVLSEFKINLERTIPAGQIDVKIDNQGGEKHEVVIVAAKDVASLPKKANGSVDEDKIPEGDKVGESGDVPARTSMTKSFTFNPGAYVALCNIVDDMGMAGTTMMGGNTTGGGNMPMNDGPMGNNSDRTTMGGGAGSGGGHVHFAQGMYTTFTVV